MHTSTGPAPLKYMTDWPRVVDMVKVVRPTPCSLHYFFVICVAHPIHGSNAAMCPVHISISQTLFCIYIYLLVSNQWFWVVPSNPAFLSVLSDKQSDTVGFIWYQIKCANVLTIGEVHQKKYCNDLSVGPTPIMPTNSLSDYCVLLSAQALFAAFSLRNCWCVKKAACLQWLFHMIVCGSVQSQLYASKCQLLPCQSHTCRPSKQLHYLGCSEPDGMLYSCLRLTCRLFAQQKTSCVFSSSVY